jgi:hypothetical protein
MHDPRMQTAGLLIVIVAMFSGIAGLCAKASSICGNEIAAFVAVALRAMTA